MITHQNTHRIINSYQRGASVCILSKHENTETKNDIKGHLSYLIPVNEISLSGDNHGKSLRTIIDNNNIQIRNAIIAANCGGCDTKNGPIQTFNQKFDLETISYLRNEKKACVVGAFAHNLPKYDVAFGPLLDFITPTPSDLGRILQECWEIAVSDPEVHQMYLRRYQKHSQPKIQLQLPGISRVER